MQTQKQRTDNEGFKNQAKARQKEKQKRLDEGLQ